MVVGRCIVLVTTFIYNIHHEKHTLVLKHGKFN